MLPPVIVQQRCVHHISSICIRNMTISLASDSSSHGPADNESFIFFTLHPSTRSDRDVLFKSEIVNYSPNPTWKNIKIISTECGSLSSVAVRLWLGNEACYMPALQWELSLKSLNCIGDTLDIGRMTFHSNAVVLGMHKSYYACSTAVTLHQASPVLDLDNWKPSYKLSSLQRIFSNMIEAKLYKSRAKHVRDNVVTIQGSKNKEMVQLEKELENVRLNISHLQKLLKRERALLHREKEIANSLKSSIEQQENKMTESGEKMTIGRCQLRKDYLLFRNKRLQLGQLSEQLAQTRQSLLSDLNLILPISQYQGPLRARYHKKASADQKSWENFLSICGVKLPESEDFHQKSDLDTSIALGYTAQLVVMVSQFLLVPLRYPIVLKGSASHMVDLVTEKMSERERIFPIHVKGNKERFLFNYGVFLLNKNIAHIRYVCGQGTIDVRKTLCNIKSLLEEHLVTRQLLESPAPSFVVSPLPLNRISSVGSLTNRSENSRDLSQFENGKSAKFTRSESVPSGMKPIQDPVVHAILRNELLGLNGSGSEPPMKHRSGRPFKPLVGRFKRMSSTISFDKSSSIDSMESMTVAPTPTTFLTGLESSGANTKDTKLSLAAARAELLGKKMERRQDTKEKLRNSSESVNSLARGRQEYSPHDVTNSIRSGSDSSRKKSSALSSISSTPPHCSVNADPNDISPFVQSSSVNEKNNVFVFDSDVNGVSSTNGNLKSGLNQLDPVTHSDDEPDLC